MADPLKIIRRLDAVATDYAVFERDQVLTHEQLNSVAEYLDDQSRLTRTQLLGVGIAGGLLPALGRGQVTVGKGVGVTSGGDLIVVAVDTVCERFLPYDERAPAYEPFYVDGKMLPLLELLPASDPRPGTPLAELGDRLGDMALIAFMESYENDPDLCTGGDCDNRGRTARNTRRFLLVDRAVAEKLGLAAGLATGADIAALLPRVAAARVDLGTGSADKLSVTSAEIFAARYRDAGGRTAKALGAAFATLAAAVRGAPDLPGVARWPAQLDAIVGKVADTRLGIQYYHAFLKDLVATWGELRAALFADDSVLCPPAGAFPKHLLLGALADPAQLRSGRYPAPWLAGGGAARERVRHLMNRMTAQLAAFAIPASTRPQPKITPSRGETTPLELRAVPIYYRDNERLRPLWNEQRHRRGESDDNRGYFWTPLPDANAADDPCGHDLGASAFFRIEGHLGMKVDDAEPAIEKLVRHRHLPIAVMSVLLHNRRDLVIRGPKFKKTSLHSLHYLLRQDLASHLKDNIAYSSRLIGDIKAAGTAVQKPSTNVLNADLVKQLEGAKAKLQTTESELLGSADQPGPLAARSYKAFAAQTMNWTVRFDDAVVTTSKAKAGLGDIMRSDLVSPVDSVAGSKSHLWVNWLGDILKKRDDDKKDRLLFTNMIADHPGLAHAGGAAPGGTFVLAYDDSGVVIGDLMLPYWIDDIDESDKDEPQLVFPDLRARLPDDLLPVKVIRPLDLVLDDFKATKILPELKIQENYSKFFRESLGSLGDVLKNTGARATAGSKYATGDALLDNLLAEVEGKQEQLQNLRNMRADEKLPAGMRNTVEAQIKRLEGELGGVVKATTEHFAITAPETVRTGSEATTVYATINQGIATVGDKAVLDQMKVDLKATQDRTQNMSGTSAQAMTHIMNIGFGNF